MLLQFKTDQQLNNLIDNHARHDKHDAPLAVAARKMLNERHGGGTECLTARVFDFMNLNPYADISDTLAGMAIEHDASAANTVKAARRIWQNTKFKKYRSKSTVERPVDLAMSLIKAAMQNGVGFYAARDIAIAAGVAHLTARTASHLFRGEGSK